LAGTTWILPAAAFLHERTWLLLLFFTGERGWENLRSFSPPDSPSPRNPRLDQEVVDSAESARLSMGRQLGSPAQLGSSASVKKMFRSATLSTASSCRPFAPADSKKKTSFACAADSLELSPLPAVVPLTLSPSPWDPCQALFQCCDVGCFSMAPTTVTGSLACVCIFVVFAFVSFSRQASLPAFSHCSSTCVSGADYR
jgi:hypothetical protein